MLAWLPATRYVSFVVAARRLGAIRTFVHHLSYRYENGDIEEFVGFGLTPSAARQNSEFCAKGVVRVTRGEAFTLARAFDITAARELARQSANMKPRTHPAKLL